MLALIVEKLMKKENSTEINENLGVSVTENKGVILVGMTYSDTKELCLDLIKNELDLYKSEAAELANKRNNEFLNAFIELLDSKKMDSGKVKECMIDPSMQIDYLEAAKSYVKYGNTDLLNVLSEILSKRIDEPNYSLLQVSLSEAIRVAPLLTEKHMAMLGLNFLIKHTKRHDLINLPKFNKYFKDCILKIYEIVKNSSYADVQHLNYSRCAVTNAFSIDFVDNFQRKYCGLFMKGNDIDKIEKIDEKSCFEKYPSLFINCLHDPSKVQFRFIDQELLEKELLNMQVDEMDKKILIKEFEKQKFSKKEFDDYMDSNFSEYKELIKYWNDSGISNLNLSSVGIVIGGLYISRKTSDNIDLKIWIQ